MVMKHRTGLPPVIVFKFIVKIGQIIRIYSAVEDIRNQGSIETGGLLVVKQGFGAHPAKG